MQSDVLNETTEKHFCETELLSSYNFTNRSDFNNRLDNIANLKSLLLNFNHLYLVIIAFK